MRLRSTQDPRLGQQLLQARLCFYRAIKRFLKGVPLLVIQDKMAAIRQRLISRINTRIQQKLADILVAGTRRLLKQLLHGRAGANINPLGFGKA